jgi:hypothetical protein
VLKKQRRHINKKQLKFWNSTGILSGQIWYINSPLWHKLKWTVKQMKKGLLFPQEQTETKFTIEPDVFTSVKK